MSAISRATLESILEEFPTVPWGAAELDELAHPRLGIITGYPKLLDDLGKLGEMDLGTTPPAGIVRGPRKR